MENNPNPMCFVAFSDGSSMVTELDKARIVITEKESNGVTVKTLQPVI